MDLRSPLPSTTVRRNPPRRAKQTPSTTSKSSSSSAAAGIPPFPIEEILDAEIPPPTTSEPQIPAPTPKTTNASSENLRVFLRIRPLEPKPKPPRPTAVRARGKGISPKSRKGSNICLVVNDSGSVTLSAPTSPFDSKRSKSEVYDGFSHVFPPDSAQKEIYERVMDPLVMDFIGGRSALLAAMGPTGSGKTHTIFGSPREPGLVPLALQKIFGCESDSEEPHSSSCRLYYLSMFEIYSERGKGERIFDLLSDGADLNLQQSTIKGLQEVMISSTMEADSLIARGMLKRATAVTNANSQSSRSQCIINICNARRSPGDENYVAPNIAVLTIADLAGAEREKKTGNQGVRMLESSFINNTSMVFGLCLRSLQEHQKNPKKPFQKHFKNSLLTRYLKVFLEGKKRMTLMLTVKPGEDDYLETSFLLRQASPYMKIKFASLEEVPNAPSQKRNTTTMLRVEHHKRRKYNLYETSQIEDGKHDKDVVSGFQVSGDDFKKHHGIESPQILNALQHFEKTLDTGTQLNEDYYAEVQRMKRNDEVMQKFAKALWNVLKQYHKKLEVSDNEVHNLKEALDKKTSQIIELKKLLKESESSTCQMFFKESSNPEVGSSALKQLLTSNDTADVTNRDAVVDANPISVAICETSERYPMTNRNPESHVMGILLDANLTEDDESKMSSSVEQNALSVEVKVSDHEVQNLKEALNIKTTPIIELEKLLKESESSACQMFFKESSNTEVGSSALKQLLTSNDTADVSNTDAVVDANHISAAICESAAKYPVTNSNPESLAMGTLLDANLTEGDECTMSSSVEQNALSMKVNAEGDECRMSSSMEQFALPVEVKQSELLVSHVEGSIQNNKSRVKNPMGKENLESDSKSSNGERPKRRLLPASAMLLKSFSGLDMEVENLKESRGKVIAEGTGRSQGSKSLIDLLKNNLHR